MFHGRPLSRESKTGFTEFPRLNAYPVPVNRPCQSKKCIRSRPKWTDSDYLEHAKRIIWAFALCSFTVVSNYSVCGQ